MELGSTRLWQVINDDSRVRVLLVACRRVSGSFLGPLPRHRICGAGALEQAGCVITEVCMPGMGGIELQHGLRVYRPLGPAIFLSACSDDDARRRAFEDGVVDFFYKSCPIRADS